MWSEEVINITFKESIIMATISVLVGLILGKVIQIYRKKKGTYR